LPVALCDGAAHEGARPESERRRYPMYIPGIVVLILVILLLIWLL
jgi:hypothetical protein